MKILLDPGHGSNTHGKRSPDGRFLEYRFNRDIALDVQKQLTLSGYDATILVPEDYDVSIRARTERVNTWCRQLGKKNVCLISIHTNAAGNGRQWMNARGWCCYTSRGQTAGDRLPPASMKPPPSTFPVIRLGKTTQTEIRIGNPTSPS